VFVGGLDYHLAEEELSRFFSEYGLVKDVQIVKDPSTNASRGFGFVTFEEESVAQHLILNV
jgi:heterogeneous nuclear ribonucleoprotein A1/A3